MADQAPAFQFYPRDFLTDEHVRLMTHTERGIYITLICFCWLEGSLPGDIAHLAMLVGISGKRMAALWDGQLGQCFYLDGLRYRHKRLDKEREKQSAYAEQQSVAGKEGARKRWGRHVPEMATPSSQNGEAIISPLAKNSSASASASASADCSHREAPVVRDEDDLAARAARFIDRYCALYVQYRQGARYHRREHLDFHHAEGLVRTWPDERLAQLAVVFLTADDPWIEGGSRTIGQFASRASWCDDLLRQHELKNGSAA